MLPALLGLLAAGSPVDAARERRHGADRSSPPPSACAAAPAPRQPGPSAAAPAPSARSAAPAPSASSAAPAPSGTPSAPSAGQGDRPYVLDDLETAYRLDVDLRWSPARLVVRERIELCLLRGTPIDAVHLSVLARPMGEFGLREVRVGGDPVTVEWPDAADMLVPMPGGLTIGERATIDIRYVLKPKGATRSSLHASLSKAEGLLRVSDWFPIVSDGHGLRLPGDSQVSAAARHITLDLSLDRSMVVAAPGRLLRREGRRHVYRIEHARDHGFLVAPLLQGASVQLRRGPRVEAYAWRQLDAERLARSAARAVDAYRRTYGPYPWARLVVAPTPRRLSGHEYPGLVFVGQAWISGRHPSEQRWLRRHGAYRWLEEDYVVAHEVAHQWFYAQAINDQLREPWLDEAVADFMARHAFAPTTLLTCAWLPVSSSVYDFPDRPSAPDCDGYTEVVYRRGAVMVDGVRRILGGKAFFEAMRALIREHRFRTVTTDDVVSAWRERAKDPKELAAYLDAYLRASD